MFVIMIIIFLNELKNITLSFLKINYLKDVADINIQKHCNNIYCEAETGRFNLAKNSYELLLPNDNFNTKTYYYTILFVIVLLFIDLMYKFWKYNDLFIPHLSNINGEYFITYLKLFPYILSFLIVFILTVMIIRRYAPTSSIGYKAYFNTDNDAIPDDINTFNINVMLNQSKNIIMIFLILYLICGFLSSIPSIPHDSRIDGLNYFYIAMAYIFILLLCFYMMVNIINITMAFTDNDKPKLEYIDFREILWSEIVELKILSDYEIINSVKQEKYILLDKDGNIRHSTRNKAYINYMVGKKIAKYLDEMDTDEKASIAYVIHKYISNIFDNPENMDDIFKDTTPLSFNEALINKLILSDSADNNSIYNFLGLQDNRSDELSDDDNKVGNHKDIINIVCNLTKVLIKKDLAKEYSKKNVDKQDKSDIEAFKESYKNYMKEKRKVKLFYSISKIQNNYNKKEKLDKDSAYEFIREYKVKLENFKQELGVNEVKEYNLYLDNPKIFKDTYEVEQTYTVDISYNSKNKYYENYFKIANGEKLNSDYNIGEYKIKNIEDLLSYIMVVIILSLVLLLMIYNITTNTNTFNSYNLFTSEIITPFLLIFIFVLFIYIFINYNTKYNLYFINGIFDSCYKRDLTHLNNKLIPFIKLHDKNADIVSNDYLDHYIVTNVFTSILNGDLIMEDNGKYENPLKLDKKFKDYATMLSMNVQFKLYNDVDTSDKVKFDNYYSKIFEETYSYFQGTNKDFNKKSKPNIYTFVESIPSSEATKIVDEPVTNSRDIDAYCKYIIDRYKNKIIKIIYICKHIFNPNNFKKNISEYNDGITNNKENILMSYFKFELSENKMEAIPYKFLLNINVDNLNKFLELANTNNFNLPQQEETEQEEKPVADAAVQDANVDAYISSLKQQHSFSIVNDKKLLTIEKIVNNFLLIIAHMKYNYEILKKHIPDSASTNIITSPLSLEAPMKAMSNTNEDHQLKNALHKLHWYENIKLFGLLTDSLYKNNTQIEIADTFNPTFNPDETNGNVVNKIYTELNYTFNMLNNYESETNNISNNYLKNVIKSIYKDINNSDIKFSNDDSNEKFEFKIDKSNTADPVDSILHKANNITGEGFFINYITNIIIIIMMYNIGNNI
jgi:hypothetical protein